MSKTKRPLHGEAKTLKNVQASARRRGFSLRKQRDGFVLSDNRPGVEDDYNFQDLGEVLDELRDRETTS